MRPPWEIAAGAPDDVESLQTDVMRFIAILGLCLTAIFSLVNAAREEGVQPAAPPPFAREPQQPTVADAGRAARQPRDTDAQVVPAQTPLPAPKPVPEPISEHRPEPVPEPRPDSAAPPAPGFTLAFASAAALERLRGRGEVALYAIAGDDYWLVGADGRARRAQPPASYYRMHADTLPQSVAVAAPQVARATQVTWAVTLPASTASRVGELVSSREGGALVIGADGSVALDP